MKRKLLAIILAVSMILTSAVYLVGCNTDAEDPTESSTDVPAESVSDTDSASETTGTVETQSEDEESESTDQSESESMTTDVSETESVDESSSETVSETESESEDASESEGETECYHPYAADHDGHWKPACDKCGKGKGRVQQHEYVEKVEDEGDLLLYSFKCTVCLFVAYEQEVPYHINTFFSAGEITKADYTGSKIEQGFGFQAGVGYTSFSSEEGGNFSVAVQSGAEPNAPTGQYLVMKVRMPKSQSSFGANIKTLYGTASMSMAYAGLSAGWCTVIVDLSKAVKGVDKIDTSTGETYTEYEGYAPDGAGDYYLSDLTITGNVGAGESLDIAYILICDKLKDAENFVKEQGGITTVYRYLDSLDVPETEKGICTDENGNVITHNYIVNADGTHTLEDSCRYCGLVAVMNEPHVYVQGKLEDGDYTYLCSICGHEKFTAKINKYFDAMAIYKTAANYYQLTPHPDGLLTDSKGGFEYASFLGQGKSNGTQIIFTRNTNEGTDGGTAAHFNVGQARYFVARLKTNLPSMKFSLKVGTMNAEPVVGTKGTFPKTNDVTIPVALAQSDVWTTFVVDLAQLAPTGWVADEKGNYNVCTFLWTMGNDAYNADVHIDFEFMAFVDSWNEIDEIVPDETVINVASGGAGNTVYTSGKCIGQHSNEVISVDGVYKVRCSICGTEIKTITVPEGINYYSDLGAMGIYQVGSLSKLQYDEENDVLYNRYDGNASSHLNLTGGGNAGTWTADKYKTGEYIVIKYRMQSLGLSLNIATKDFGQDPNYKDQTRPYYTQLGQRKCASGLSYWSVALIKIPDTIGDKEVRYTKGEMQEIGIMMSVGSSPYIFDVAYIAIVDSPEEAALLLEEGEVLEDLGESWAGEITEVMPEEPDSDEPEEGKEYSSTVLDADKLLTPPETTGSFNIQKMEENGVSFVRINNMTVNKDGWAAVNYLNNSNVATGRYFAMKFRIGDNGLDQTYLKLYTGTTGSLQGEGQAVSFKVVEGGEWCVVVVDLLNCIGSKGEYMVKSNGSYVLRYFAIRPFSNNQSGATSVDENEAEADATYMYKYTYPDAKDASKLKTAWSAVKLTDEEAATKGWTYVGRYRMAVNQSDYIDIAYIKFFEHKSQIKDIVDTETYEWSVDKSTSTTLKTEDNSCVVCSVSETKVGSTYNYTCAACGKVHKSITLSESVTRYYSANEIATTGKVYFSTTAYNCGFAVEDGVAYTKTESLMQIIWQRVMADMDGKNSSGSNQQYSESVGNAKYLVIKTRTSGEKGYVSLQLSTVAHNATLNVATENKPGFYKGYTNQRDSWVDDKGETVTGVLAGGEYRTTPGYKSVYIIPTGTGDGKWQTYVIDLAAVYGERYAKAEGAEDYEIDSFFLNFGGDVDISYMAFIDGDWADIDQLVDESTVANITDASGAHTVVNTADGKPVNAAQ